MNCLQSAPGTPLCEQCTEGFYERCLIDNAPMPLSNKEKQDAYRARKAMLGLTEVRGIFLPPELHEKLKEAAKKLLRKVPPSRIPTAK
jgi:hypothetical protein